ncbi:cytochrome P450 2F2-like [Conger conger]|uniref:cytochrome P450 2F2-like n=1 Tax=Conger conger TaxID=82655 RepID=UPI002A5A022E|nr:cytochrome P450 2F2-like [Conger conger]
MLGSVILLCISFSLFILFVRTRRPTNFPPGPRLIPMFGNMLQLNLVDLLNDLKKLSERYGKVYSIYLGRKPVVVLNGLQAMKEALVTQSVEFAGRPKDHIEIDLTERKGLTLTDGPMWKAHRRFALTTLRNFGMGKHSMEERILGEISYTASHLEKNAGKATDPQTLFHEATFNIICTVLFGTRFKHEDEFMQLNIRCIRETTKIINGPWSMIYDTLPLVRNLPLPFQKAFENRDLMKKSLGDQVSQHKKSWVPGEQRDLIDCYLDEMEKRGDDGSSFYEEQLIFYLMDLLFAGTDTTSNTLLTAFLYLMTHPDVQERCQKEIDEVLGEKEQVSFEDRHRMPYTQAMIHEVQRVADTVPLSVIHATTKDTRLMGYDIPKGTIIIPNLSSVLSEENQWKFPHEFNPSNFLNDQGEFVKPEAFMPFSAGPRVCVGEGLARMELFLILVTLLRRFKFVWPEDAGVPDYTPVFGVTQTPKPYRLGVRLRGSGVFHP